MATTTLIDLRAASDDDLMAIQAGAGAAFAARGLSAERLIRSACDAAGIRYRGAFHGRSDWAAAVAAGRVEFAAGPVPADWSALGDDELIAAMVAAKRAWDERH